jgi:hypothetical protein
MRQRPNLRMVALGGESCAPEIAAVDEFCDKVRASDVHAEAQIAQDVRVLQAPVSHNQV